MATKVKSSVVEPSAVEHGAVVVVKTIVTGDCAFVRGVMAGWQLREHAAAQRDARVADLVEYYMQQ